MNSVTEEIKARLDIVDLVNSYIRLQKAGSNYRALCPFHKEKTPSFNVSPARQIWHCFGCGLGGDHFKFVMQIEGLEFPDALEMLAKRAGVELRREDPRLRSERARLTALVEDATKIFEAALHATKNPEVRVSAPLAYLKQRGLTEETVNLWRIGYAPDSWDWLTRALKSKGYSEPEIEKAGLAVKSEQGTHYDRFRNRITFPVTDASGRVVGFSGRIFDAIANKQETADGQQKTTTNQQEALSRQRTPPAKYINSPQTPIYDKSRVLFGLDKARQDIARQDAVILVEGQMDCVLSHQAGIKNVVAVSGTALSVDQLKTLRRIAKTMVSSFDRDVAGEMATKRSMDLAAKFDFERKVAFIPKGFKDPADAVVKDPAIWQSAVTEARPLVQYFLDVALARHDRKTASGKRAIAEAVLPEIKILGSEVEKSHWMQTLSREIEIPEEALWRELERARPAAADVYLAPDPERPAAAPSRRSQLESLLVGTFLLNPADAASILLSFPKGAILDETHLRILEILERTLVGNAPEPMAVLAAAIPEDLRDRTQYLAFQAEILLERIENPRDRMQEMATLARELELEWARGRLRTLSADISNAERSGEKERLESLLGEFRTLAERMR